MADTISEEEFATERGGDVDPFVEHMLFERDKTIREQAAQIEHLTEALNKAALTSQELRNEVERLTASVHVAVEMSTGHGGWTR